MTAQYPPPNRAHNLSPASVNTNEGSEWSGMNNYESQNRSNSPYSATLVTPPIAGGFNFNGEFGGPMGGGYNIVPPPIPGEGGRRPSDTPSRNPSPAHSNTNSRSSDGTLSDQQSRRYRRMEMEVSQHYQVLRAYLRGGAPQPPRPNKARDKLLRLSPVQFHELSTDVFDELQRRQASAPLPGRPRRDQVPPFLQPRPDFHEKRNQARQKLSSLQTSRFRDLSTDVFCELERRFPHFMNMDNGRRQSPGRGHGSRGQGSMGLPSGPGNGGFAPPPRTHSAGMSISSNGTGQRRGPNGSIGGPSAGGLPQSDNGPGDSDYGRPMPKQFQSNTMVPYKSTMVEDEDDSGYQSRFDRSSDAFGLESALTNSKSRDTTNTSRSSGSNRNAKLAEMQEKIDELTSILKLKDEEVSKLEESSKSTVNSEWIEVKQDLEQKLYDAEQLNQSMQDKLDQSRTEQASIERDLRSKLDIAKKASMDNTLKTKHEQLVREHQNLHEKLTHQRQITEEVRQQGAGFLAEMREMADSGGGNLEREEKLQSDVHKLEDELKEWKTRYTKTKTQLRNMKAISLGMSMAMPDASRYAKDNEFHSQSGVVKDVHITKFQIAIDELLQTARAGEPIKVLEYMKPVVVAVRIITMDIDQGPQLDKDDDNAKKRTKLKSKVSATANNVITACRNYAAAGGVSPVSLLDAAASHLTIAIVELIRAVKIRPTPPGELEDEDGEMVEGTGKEGYFDVGKSLRRISPNESIYSAISTPPPGDANGPSNPGPEVTGNFNGNLKGEIGTKPGFGLREEEEDLEELKLYLEDQTDLLVQTIQALVASIRSEDVMPLIRSHISGITDVVGNVISATEGSIEEGSESYSETLKESTEPILSILDESMKKMVKASVDSQGLESAKKGDAKVKMFTQTLPPLAFSIARDMKGLMARLEDMSRGGGQGEDEDFS